MNPEIKGTLLVLATAVISGFSIFLNKFAVSGIDSGILTALKAVVVSGFLISALLAFRKAGSLKKLSLKEWKNLAIIGFGGGGIAFLLFFQGLSITSAVNASFVHKTLFIFAGAFAFFLLKEKIEKRLLLAGLLAFAALFLLFGFQISAINLGDLLILAAVLIWSLEIVFAKKVLEKLDGTVVAFGRMFFGSILLLAFLAFSGKGGEILSLNFQQIEWIAITGALLFAYVITFYNGLKLVKVSKAAIILLAAIPITALLSSSGAKPFNALDFFLNLLILTAVGIALFSAQSFKQFFAKKLHL